MAKTYSNNDPESGSNAPVRTNTAPAYSKFVPIIIGLLILFLVIGFVVRSQTSRQTSSSTTSGTGETGGAARTAEETPTQGAGKAQETPIAPPGPKGARATGN